MRRPASMLTRLTRLGIAAALGIAMVGMTADRAAACRCGPVNEAPAMAAADVAFAGTVASVIVQHHPHDPVDAQPDFIYQFAIDTPLKGLIERGKVNVSALSNPRGCGIEMAEGQRWVIFATVSDATLITDACSRSHLGERQELAANDSRAKDTGLPSQVLIVGVVLVALIGVSAWAFGFLRARRPR